MGWLRRKPASAASLARCSSMNTRQARPSWKARPKPSTWSPVMPPRADNPVKEKVAALGVLLFRAKIWHMGGQKRQGSVRPAGGAPRCH